MRPDFRALAVAGLRWARYTGPMDLASALAAVIGRPRDDAPRERFADLIAAPGRPRPPPAAPEPATAAFIRA